MPTKFDFAQHLNELMIKYNVYPIYLSEYCNVDNQYIIDLFSYKSNLTFDVLDQIYKYFTKLATEIELEKLYALGDIVIYEQSKLISFLKRFFK